MNAQDLKNSILQLAIQGKLVEQRKEEGTAKELLKQIQAEKEQLIKEKKIKKESPLAGITREEIPFDIPESWEWVRLGDVASIFGRIGYRGYTKDDMVNKGEGSITISPSNITVEGNMNFDNCSYISWDKYEESPEIMIYDGDIILVKTGSSYGKCAVVKGLPEKATLNPQLVVLKNILCDNKFLDFALKSSLAKNQYERFVIGTSIPTFSQAKLSSLVISLPPLKEQKRIVAKIEELTPYIEKYDEAHSKLEEFNKKFPEDMQKSILQYAIQGKLVEQREEEGTAEELYHLIQEEKAKLIKEGKIKKEKPLAEITEDEVPFEIPENWKWVRLGDIGFTNIGLTYKPTNISDKGTIVLRSSNIYNGKLVYDDIVKVEIPIPESKMCKKGDVLICARNGSKRLVGKAAIIDKENMSFGAFMAIYRSICNEYILYVINSAYFRNSLLPETGTTTINQITQDTLRNFLLPLPPLEEQKRIVAQIEEMLPYCQQLVK